MDLKILAAKCMELDEASREAEVLRSVAMNDLRTRLKEFYSHWRDPDQQPTSAQLHDLRISGKRLRYSADFLRALYPDRLTLLIDLLKKLQDLLGEMQDCEMQRAVVEADLARRKQRKPARGETAARRLADRRFPPRAVTNARRHCDHWYAHQPTYH